MRTVQIKITSEDNPITEYLYAYNNEYGIAITNSEKEAQLHKEAIKVEVKAGHMYCNISEEWESYIRDCAISALVKEDLTITNSYGTYIKYPKNETI